METTVKRPATEEETEYIQMVYKALNEKCALDYAEALGVTDWKFCTECVGKTPHNENAECTFCNTQH